MIRKDDSLTKTEEQILSDLKKSAIGWKILTEEAEKGKPFTRALADAKKRYLEAVRQLYSTKDK